MPDVGQQLDKIVVRACFSKWHSLSVFRSRSRTNHLGETLREKVDKQPRPYRHLLTECMQAAHLHARHRQFREHDDQTFRTDVVLQCDALKMDYLRQFGAAAIELRPRTHQAIN